MAESMTSRQRLLAILRGQPTDRIGCTMMGVRTWNAEWRAKRHGSYRRVIDAVWEQGDWITPIGYENGFYDSVAPLRMQTAKQAVAGHENVLHEVTVVEGPRGPLRQVVAVDQASGLPMTVEHYLKTPSDAENFLAMRSEPPQPAIDRFLERDRQIGGRGIVMIGFTDAVGHLHDLMGTQTLAMWSIEHRDVLHRLLAELNRRKLAVMKHLASTGLYAKMPVLLGYTGPEIVLPPLHGPEDFRDFCLRYNKPVHDVIHESGGFVHVHSHGSVSKVLEDFVEMGADMLHPVEAPPMGDTPLADAKRRIGARVVIEGNVQISHVMEEEPEAFRRRVEAVIAEGKPGGRFCLCPTASPYAVEMSDRATTNYLALLELAQSAGRY
jgi:uroporphyrinogen-III decarboxylase